MENITTTLGADLAKFAYSQKQRVRYLRYKARNPEAAKQASRKWRKAHPGYKSPKSVKLTEMVRELKSKPCSDCCMKYPYYCMEFDHRDPKEKYLEVGSMVAHNYSTEKVLLEIAKCDLVCSNCHRIRTWGKSNG